MPFDAIAPSFTSMVNYIGIEPVDPELLATHKLREVRRHPGSWWYHHRHLAEAVISVLFSFGVLSIIFGGSLAMAFGSAMCSVFALGGLALLLLLLFSGVLLGRLILIGPATWVESDVTWNEVPPTISAMARYVLHKVPGCTVVIGRLTQDIQVLDPYLVIRRNGEEVCLGVWDGDTITYQASRR